MRLIHRLHDIVIDEVLLALGDLAFENYSSKSSQVIAYFRIYLQRLEAVLLQLVEESLLQFVDDVKQHLIVLLDEFGDLNRQNLVELLLCLFIRLL